MSGVVVAHTEGRIESWGAGGHALFGHPAAEAAADDEPSGPVRPKGSA